jgi:hypothetical protein
MNTNITFTEKKMNELDNMTDDELLERYHRHCDSLLKFEDYVKERDRRHGNGGSSTSSSCSTSITTMNTTKCEGKYRPQRNCGCWKCELTKWNLENEQH